MSDVCSGGAIGVRPVESQFGARGNYAHGAPVPSPLQVASHPNQTSFVVSGLSENTQIQQG